MNPFSTADRRGRAASARGHVAPKAPPMFIFAFPPPLPALGLPCRGADVLRAGSGAREVIVVGAVGISSSPSCRRGPRFGLCTFLNCRFYRGLVTAAFLLDRASDLMIFC